MARTPLDNTKIALAFSAVVIVGAGFVAANFDGVRERPPEEPEYAIVEAEPEPEANPEETNGGDAWSDSGDAYAAPADDWYDDPFVETGNGGPLGAPPGSDPAPARPPDPGQMDYGNPDGGVTPAEAGEYVEDY
ncbi:MAG: hypothetical protein V2I39_00155 [Erythrobacter sp.]|jgi:hypothetical protein|nr:hypothetical protein [Erythrobacter sp.]